jgi:hypothetical protein
MKGTLFYAALTLLSGTLLASAEPNFPKEYLGTYGEWTNGNCKETESGWTCKPPKVFNGFVVAPTTGGKTRVWLYESGARSACEFDGVGNWSGNELIASRAADDRSGVPACDLAVKFDKNTATTSGKTPGCTWECGSWINVKRAPKISPKIQIPPKQ